MRANSLLRLSRLANIHAPHMAEVHTLLSVLDSDSRWGVSLDELLRCAAWHKMNPDGEMLPCETIGDVKEILRAVRNGDEISVFPVLCYFNDRLTYDLKTFRTLAVHWKRSNSRYMK